MEQREQQAGRILVIDDEKPVGLVLQSWLTRKGFYVRHALDFDEVSQFFASDEFDLVTLDIMMPGVDGLQVLRWLREHFPDVGVIMATALGDLDSVLEAMRLGAINYLIKPFNMELITEEIERGMERQRLIAENRSYQRELEQKVEERTRKLQERTRELQEAHGRLERQLQELEGRDRLVRFQMTMHSLEEACAEVLEVLRETLGVERGVLYRPADGGERLEVAASMGMGEDVANPSLEEVEEPSVRAFVRGELVEGMEEEIAVPVIYRDEILGVFSTARPPASMNRKEFIDALLRLSGEAALVLRGALVTEDLENETFSLDGLEDIEEGPGD